MIVCDICGKKIENDDTENYVALGEKFFMLMFVTSV